MALPLRRDPEERPARTVRTAPRTRVASTARTTRTTTVPRLTVVPRRRRAAGFVVTLSVLIVGLMLGAAMLHTQLAERQLRIDRLDRSVREAEDRFDVLRRQRAELRAPTRLATEARALGMVPADVTEFVEVDGGTIAMAIAATGHPSTDGVRVERPEPLDQFLLVKRATNEVP